MILNTDRGVKLFLECVKVINIMSVKTTLQDVLRTADFVGGYLCAKQQWGDSDTG